VIGPVGRLSLVACAITIGGSIWALWDLGSFMGLRYGLEGFAGLQAFDPVFIANSDINPLEPGFGPWFQPGLASWLATAGFVLFVASIGLGAALWRPRPRVAREAATVEVTD
jgi:hypothetical protein